MVPPLEESEDGNRASFPRWGKRSVISNHFTELVLKITEMEMHTQNMAIMLKCFTYERSDLDTSY